MSQLLNPLYLRHQQPQVIKYIDTFYTKQSLKIFSSTLAVNRSAKAFIFIVCSANQSTLVINSAKVEIGPKVKVGDTFKYISFNDSQSGFVILWLGK